MSLSHFAGLLEGLLVGMSTEFVVGASYPVSNTTQWYETLSTSDHINATHQPKKKRTSFKQAKNQLMSDLLFVQRRQYMDDAQNIQNERQVELHIHLSMYQKILTTVHIFKVTVMLLQNTNKYLYSTMATKSRSTFSTVTRAFHTDVAVLTIMAV